MQGYRAQVQASTKPLAPATHSQNITHRRYAYVKILSSSVSVIYVLPGRCNKKLGTVVTGSEQKRGEDVDSQIDPKSYSLCLFTRTFR